MDDETMPSRHDAFQVLMSGGKKRKKSRFPGPNIYAVSRPGRTVGEGAAVRNYVECPLCSASVASANLRNHLERTCALGAVRNIDTRPPSTTMEDAAVPAAATDGDLETLQNRCAEQNSALAAPPEENAIDEAIKKKTEDSRNGCVFHHMMKAANQRRKQQRFHLRWNEYTTNGILPATESDKLFEDFFGAIRKKYGDAGGEKKMSTSTNGYPELSWEDSGNCSESFVVNWNDIILLDGPPGPRPAKKRNIRGASPLPPPGVELILSTDCVPAAGRSATTTTDGGGQPPPASSRPIRKPFPFRLVVRPSGLSVPVLKSMLQKCVRRRRPMPSVRIAMELAQKSWSDLIRRLPLIVLEDSLLHPDFPLLVWLVVADSRNFIPPLGIIRHVMKIVYEISSCPWKDSVEDISVSNLDDGGDIFLAIYDGSSGLSAKCSLVLQTMLLRIRYGGMSGDMEMIKKYVLLWYARYLRGEVPDSLQKRLYARTAGSPDGARIDPVVPFEFREVPFHPSVHGDARARSDGFVPEISGGVMAIDRLRAGDACPAGVDFHCSSILEDVLGGRGNFFDDLRVARLMKSDCVPPCRENATKLAKEAMWKFRSSVNYKASLMYSTSDLIHDDKTKARHEKLKQIWDELLKDDVETHAKGYISCRLV